MEEHFTIRTSSYPVGAEPASHRNTLGQRQMKATSTQHGSFLTLKYRPDLLRTLDKDTVLAVHEFLHAKATISSFRRNRYASSSERLQEYSSMLEELCGALNASRATAAHLIITDHRSQPDNRSASVAPKSHLEMYS